MQRMSQAVRMEVRRVESVRAAAAPAALLPARANHGAKPGVALLVEALGEIMSRRAAP